MTEQLAQNVLDYWHCVEFFNHYDLDDQITSARDDQRPEFLLADAQRQAAQWSRYDGRPRDVYLLPFEVRLVSALLLEHHAAPDELARLSDEEHAPEGRTCFAKLRWSADGIPDFNGMSLCTLPWAGGMQLSGRLQQLRATVFEDSVEEVKQRIASAWSCRDEQTSIPEFLSEVADLLVDWAGFAPPAADIAWVEVQPVPALDTKDTRDAKPAATQPLFPEQQELPILNSFFYHDLTLAAAVLAQPDAQPNPLARYLAPGGVEKLDLETAAGERDIHATLDPALTNAGRWPTEPHLLQSLMQQYALNKMRALEPGGIVSVNGPPGTGKTTLVKDLIADLVIERATVLAGLARAADGLGPSVTIGFGSDSSTFPSLLPALAGYEILVASSNNGAVENLSLELPQLKGIAAEHQDTLRHFAEVATKYAGAQANRPWQPPTPPVWGLISAALGNARNRQRFQQVFVYSAKAPADRQGKRFMAAKDVDLDAWDAAGAMNYWRFLKQRKGSVASFDSSKRRFLAARADLAQYQAHQGALRKKWLALIEAWHAARPALELHAEVQQDLAPMVAELDAGIARLGRQLAQVELSLWPSMLRWLMRWFSSRKFQGWLDARSALLRAAGLRDDLEMVLKLQQKTGQLQLWDGATLDSHRNQQTALWHGVQYNRLRNELFAAAMALHQAFVLEAAPNEVGRALSNLLGRRVTDGSPLPAWQWLFMLTPVVSSTFASVRKQFRDVPEGSFGWLIVDEAGQAVPQAAVGALLRARRAVVVGDPLQIEPVVGVPVRLLDKLGQLWLGDQAPAYAVHRQSVQTLADRAHGYGVRHPQRAHDYIGIPLVMHRRCANPMFDIANQIAYRERMRHARDSAVADHPVLGRSAWWDVKGRCAEGKYVAEQGALLLERLVALYLGEVAQGRTTLPDLYVITPFREVKTGLQRVLLDAAAWTARLAPHRVALPTNLVALPTNLVALRGRIGTVHTFQGKEAEIVFLVLGCDEGRTGAMQWAAASPNLLNVAVTRAREYCYIIGDAALWGRLPHFEVAARELGVSLRAAAAPWCP